MFYIGMEDVVANALIQIMRSCSRGNESAFLSYENIEEYGMKVISYLQSNKERAVLIFSRSRTDEMLDNYADFFEETIGENGELGIRLRADKQEKDLVLKFRGYLPVKVLRAFVTVPVAA